MTYSAAVDVSFVGIPSIILSILDKVASRLAASVAPAASAGMFTSVAASALIVGTILDVEAVVSFQWPALHYQFFVSLAHLPSL
jgi:hypothetical protein